LQNPSVQAAIRKTSADLGLAWEQVQRRLNAMITTSISDVLWWDEEQVHLRPFEEIPEEVRWAIESITETQTPMGPKREIKLVSRLQAIKLRAQLERRLAPDGQNNFYGPTNVYKADPDDGDGPAGAAERQPTRGDRGKSPRYPSASGGGSSYRVGNDQRPERPRRADRLSVSCTTRRISGPTEGTISLAQ